MKNRKKIQKVKKAVMGQVGQQLQLISANIYVHTVL
jgi:hypothetical protein